MANSLYIAGVEPRSGKSLVAMGIMELLSRRVRKVGISDP
jgi:phosphate acetyltransferase